MNSEATSYPICPSEMARRRVAYTTVCISLFCGVAAGTIDLLIAHPAITCGCLVGIALLLLLSCRHFFAIFRKMESATTLLTSTHLERVAGASSKQYPLDAVIGLWVKKTVKRTIREIRISFSDTKRISITGLRDFETFRHDLQKRLNKEVPSVEFKELIDFDHPCYYVFFGFFTGLIAVGFIRFLPLLDRATLKWVQIGLIGLILSTGIFWLVNRPLSRYAISSPLADYLFGSLVVVAGIALSIYSFINL